MEATAVYLKETRYAVVTGGNRGIGLEICRQLASDGVLVILTARDEQKGREATENLKASGPLDVVFHQLDVKNSDSITALAKFIETKFGKLDILVNNAGYFGATLNWEALEASIIAGDTQSNEDSYLSEGLIQQTYQQAEECLKTNYYGTRRVTEALLPLLQQSQSPRIVNISSSAGLLMNINNEKIRAELENVDELTAEKLDGIVKHFLQDFKENKLQDNGWPLLASAYKVSKVAINAYTRLIARKHPSFLVNCVHPGYVKTDMTAGTGPLTSEDGARAPVMLALLPDDGPSGLYFDQMNPASF